MYRNLLLMAVCLSSTLLSTGHGQINRLAPPLPVASPAAASPAAASPASRSLAEMFELALRSNPEVVQAEATVRQAEADLNQVRLKVMQEVITAYHEGRKQRVLLGYYEEEAENYKRRFAVGQATQGEGNQALRQVAATRASLAQTEARLLYILGTGYGRKSVAPIGPAAAVPPMVAPGLPLPSPRIPEEFIAFLEAPTDLSLQEGQELGEVFGLLRDLTRMNFIVDEEVDLGVTIETPLELSGVTVRKALLALVDKFEGICFVFRDYGVFVTLPKKAATLRSATIPPRDELPRVSR